MPGRLRFTADARTQNRPVPCAAEVGEAAGAGRCAFAELRWPVSRCELGRGRSRGLLHSPAGRSFGTLGKRRESAGRDNLCGKS